METWSDSWPRVGYGNLKTEEFCADFQLGDSVSTAPFPRFFIFVPEHLWSSFQPVSRTTRFIHIPGTHTCFFAESKLKGFFPFLLLSPSPNLSLFINCTTWHGSTVTNVQAEGLIISYSFWCWFCKQTDQKCIADVWFKYYMGEAEGTRSTFLLCPSQHF